MRRSLLAAVLVIAAWVVPGRCRAAGDEWVIGPGQETLVGEMLGRGAADLPDGCRLKSGGVRYAAVEATYACRAGEVVIGLLHPGAAGDPAAVTHALAIVVRNGAPSAAFVAELERRISSREAAFQWTRLRPDPPATAPDRWPHAAALLPVFAIVFWLLWRFGFGDRRRAATRRLRSMLPHIVGRLFASLLGIAAAWAAAEPAVRWSGIDERVMDSALLFQQSNPEVHRVADDWFLHFDLRPGARLENTGYWGNRYRMSIDAFGARAPGHPAEKGEEVFRVLCFGGSTMYGADVSDDETIPAALERHLNAAAWRDGQPARRYEAWNFGTHAYVLSQAARRARTELRRRDPDLILVQLHNVGPRAFFLEPGMERWGTLRRFVHDPHIVPEYFPPPAMMPAPIHVVLLRRSAAYRLLAGFLRRVDRTDFPYAEELGREEARMLVREAAARSVPVVFVSIPSDGSGPRADTVFPELPEEQFINFYEPGHEPDYYMMHPPPRVLDEYAAQLIAILRRRGLLPHR